MTLSRNGSNARQRRHRRRTGNTFHGARPAAKLALARARQPADVRLVLVNNTAGALILDQQGRPATLMAFTITADTITEIEILSDPGRLHRLNAEVTGP
ncbi:MAG: hypothetical protein ACRDRN_19440 [Sciscionella sp.]